MSRRIFFLALSGFITIVIFNWSCTKLDTTTVGSDLIPAVDNINTFDTSFSIISAQGAFEGIEKDTSRLLLTDNYALGKTNDILFGQTDAELFLQFKPGFYPYYIGIANDTIIAADSVVLCLSYKGAYGDTSALSGLIKLQVFDVPLTQHGEWDSLRTLRDINYAPAISTALSPETSIDMDAVKMYKKIGKGNDSVINQIRINLSSSSQFISRIFGADSAYAPEGGFSRDTFFRSKVSNGFAIKMTQGNRLLYTQLSDANTRLELHYKKKNGGVTDTAMSSLEFNTGSNGTAAPRRSAVANRIVRTRTTPLPFPGDQEIYIQAAPGTYASLKIPQLSGYSNRIIHRAEIILEQIPDASDLAFTAPGFLYLDLVDSGLVPKKWKPVYYDLNPSLPYDPDNKSGLPYYPATGEVDLQYLGAAAKKTADPAGISGTHLTYRLNVTRYVQKMVINQTPNYEIRVYAPHAVIYPQYAPTIYPYVNNIAQGRVRVGGGSLSVDQKYRMRLRIIYSPLQ